MTKIWRSLQSLRLEKENFTVDICVWMVRKVFYYMQENMYDLVLLDCMLPSMDGNPGFEGSQTVQHLNPCYFPYGTLANYRTNVNGLNCGADDYMVKPFAFEELLARIHSIMRRPGKWGDLNLLKLGDIAFDP